VRATVLPALVLSTLILPTPGILPIRGILTAGPRAATLTTALMAAWTALAGPRVPGLRRPVTELALLFLLRCLLSLLLRDEPDFQQLIAQ
jgi:hypothetical protein